MKTSLFIVLIAVTATLSITAHAIPPSPPSLLPQAPKVIICSNLKSLNFEDLFSLNIISYNIFTNEICTTEK